MTKTTWLLTTAILALATTAHAQEPVGAYTLQRGGTTVGSVVIEPEGTALVLTTHMNDGTSRPIARRTTGRTFAYSSQVSTSGLTGALTGTPTPPPNATWTVELTAGQPAGTYKASVKANGTQIFDERLVKVTKKSVLLVPASAYDPTHVNAFKGYAAQVGNRYKASGYGRADVVFGESWDAVFTALLSAEKENRQYDRVVFIGHGGWDGPILGGSQVSSHDSPANFATFVDAIRRGTKPDAKILSSSCHAGGSNKYEAANEFSNKYRWVDDVADLTGRTTAGPNGYTSTEYTQQHVWALLEGQGTTRQECRWASREGVKTVGGGGTLAGTALKPKAPIVRPTPAPAPTPTSTSVSPPTQ